MTISSPLRKKILFCFTCFLFFAPVFFFKSVSKNIIEDIFEQVGPVLSKKNLCNSFVLFSRCCHRPRTRTSALASVSLSSSSSACHMTTPSSAFNRKKPKETCAVVVALLVERSHPTPEIGSLNPFIGKILSTKLFTICLI